MAEAGRVCRAYQRNSGRAIAVSFFSFEDQHLHESWAHLRRREYPSELFRMRVQARSFAVRAGSRAPSIPQKEGGDGRACVAAGLLNGGRPGAAPFPPKRVLKEAGCCARRRLFGTPAEGCFRFSPLPCGGEERGRLRQQGKKCAKVIASREECL